ncbi:YraN family protein [Candidatus Nesciobacter abundans]|uniref:YraN family protein n=1 Tax=Candidatus Nesciobacter abundans TaxID=2601668 RepID=UPI001653EC00|nr:YraN family protein [Candidatus Nesciobacter abundans]
MKIRFFDSYKKGILYEVFSIIYLKLRGFKILAWRYKTPVGEIDIIAFKKNTVFAFEVKYRKEMESCAWVVADLVQQKRIEKALSWFLNSKEAENKLSYYHLSKNRKSLSNNSYINKLNPKIEYIFWYKAFRMYRIC